MHNGKVISNELKSMKSIMHMKIAMHAACLCPVLRVYVCCSIDWSLWLIRKIIFFDKRSKTREIRFMLLALLNTIHISHNAVHSLNKGGRGGGTIGKGPFNTKRVGCGSSAVYFHIFSLMLSNFNSRNINTFNSMPNENCNLMLTDRNTTIFCLYWIHKIIHALVSFLQLSSLCQ